MKTPLSLLAALVALACCNPHIEPDSAFNSSRMGHQRPANLSTEQRFAVLALECVHREYPNKISHVLQSSDDALSPRILTPAFYGCYDWHSSVHGHWLLSRLLELEPEGALADEIRESLSISFTRENIQAELTYYLAPGRNAFERPYGIAWFLQLVAELDESSDPDAQAWREVLRPLEVEIVRRVKTWVPDLVYPIRSGTHNQTAFAFGLMIDYARQVRDRELEALLIGKSRAFHLNDTQCPLRYEPSGDDFLSPCLMEADLMRRVLTPGEFSIWLHEFLPEIPVVERDDWLQPGVVLDAADVKLVHLDGLNLSRAWALEGIAAALSDEDLRRASLLASARRHREAGISAVSGEHYAGSHWLASFATYLVTKRGVSGG